MVCSFGAHAGAAERVARPWEIGVRTGFSLMTGELLTAVPIGVDLTYRLTPRWSIGGYGQLGFAWRDLTEEDADRNIKAQHYRFGLQALYHFAPEPPRPVSGWVGFGTGLDVLRGSDESSGSWPFPYSSSRPYRATGFELLNLQAGFDVLASPVFVFGPFVSGSLVTYGKRQGLQNDDDFNVWATAGVKGTFQL